MRIAVLTNVVYPFVTGGAEKRIYEIGRRLSDRGHDITIFGRHYWDGPKVMSYEGMTLRAVSPSRELYTENEGRRSIKEALEFAKDIIIPLRRNIDKYDIVVASVFPYFPVLTSKIFTFPTDTPLITIWHEVWGDYWNDYLGRLGAFGKVVEHITARCPQHPIAVSGVTADRLAEVGPNRDFIRVISNGIDFNRIRAVEPAKEGFDVLFAGRLIQEKRVDILLQAFDRICSSDTRLGIIGDGPKRDDLEELAAGLNSTDRITFLGFLDDYEDVLRHMRAAEIFASPSTREGFGITYAEAMAADCTVIGSTHPDSAASEVISSAGFLVPPTVDDLADILEKSLDGRRPPQDPVKRSQQYDWDNITDAVEDAYQNAIEGKW